MSVEWKVGDIVVDSGTLGTSRWIVTEVDSIYPGSLMLQSVNGGSFMGISKDEVGERRDGCRFRREVLAPASHKVRPPVERYVRAVYNCPQTAHELILGIAYDNAVEYFSLLSISKMLLRDAVASLSGSHAVTNPALLAEAVEAEVVKQWPDRLFFLEVCSAGDRDGWCQVYSGQVAKLDERIFELETLLDSRTAEMAAAVGRLSRDVSSRIAEAIAKSKEVA